MRANGIALTNLDAGCGQVAVTSRTAYSGKTCVRGSHHHPAGRLTRRAQFRSSFSPVSRGCAYKPASGRLAWPSRDPLGELGFEILRLRKQQLHCNKSKLLEGLNRYTFNFNNPVGLIDPDGLCSRPPKPKPGDPYGCWGAGNPKGLPIGGPAKPVNCLNIRSGCIQCCEDKFPITNSDPDGYGSCIASCEANYTWCAAYGTTTPILPIVPPAK
jgi:hypothetical protein